MEQETIDAKAGSLLMEKLAKELGVEFVRSDEDHDTNLIRMRLRLPPEQRTDFLRVMLPNGGSAL